MSASSQYVADARHLRGERRTTSEASADQQTQSSRRGTLSSEGHSTHQSRAGSSSSHSKSSSNPRSALYSDTEYSPPPVFDSFDSSFLSSPTASVRQTPLSTRRSSTASSVSERFTHFAGKVRKQFQRNKKHERRNIRVAQPDILDKPDTKKLNRFWDLTYPERHQVNTTSEETAEEKPPILFGPRELHDNTEVQSHRFLTVTEFLLEGRLASASSRAAVVSSTRLRLSSIPEHSRATIDSACAIMDVSRLMPNERVAADQQDKARRVEDAQGMYQTIKRNAERSNTAVPPYDFLELIGKGAYGRVYKCRDQRTGDLVAVKIAEVEYEDSSAKLQLGQDRESSIREVQKEVKILQTLKENKAKNVNVIHDAFDLHSQLWIVTDYCTGGSVRTLQRPFHTDGKMAGLPEHYIIPIARELAIAMKSLHDMRIVHRDIKASNIYITEDGALQLGDFGVTAIAEDDRHAKRKTVIGTKNYMPVELLRDFDKGIKEDGYGGEVDVYAYGCTIIEMATGSPPFARIPGDDLDADVVAEAPPSLDMESISPELRELTNACLALHPNERPTAEMILQHPVFEDSETKYPTSSLIKLIEKFKLWEHGGGSRISLWWGGGADRPVTSSEGDEEQVGESDDSDGWTFSTSDDFDRRFSQMPSFDERDFASLQAPPGAGMPPELAPLNTKGLTVAERIRREHSELSANRGEKSLARLYDMKDKSGYQISTPKPVEEEEPAPVTDLPLREFTAGAPTRESMIEIDLDDIGSGGATTTPFSLDMDTVHEDTIRPGARTIMQDDDEEEESDFNARGEDGDRRATMEWTFPGTQAPQPSRDTMSWTFPSTQAQDTKRGTMEWTFQTAEPAPADDFEFTSPTPSNAPIVGPGDFSTGAQPAALALRDSMSSMIDLDLGFSEQPARLDDPAEIVRPTTASSSAASDMTSGNPWDLEDELNEMDRNRFSYHKQWQSEGGHFERHSQNPVAMHARGSSLSSTDSDTDPRLGATYQIPHSAPRTNFQYGQELEMSPEDINQWPNFSDFDSFDSSPEYRPRTTESIYTQSQNGYTNGFTSTPRESGPQLPGLEIPFPRIDAPHPDALAEDADPQMLEDELYRSLNGLAMGLKSVENALRRYANIDDENGYDPGSDSEHGFESAKEGTGTEDDGEEAQLTTRRNKPRRLELRSSPRPATAETSQ